MRSSTVVQANLIATLRLAQLVLSTFLPIQVIMQNEPVFRVPLDFH